jgi:hypothetical protein
MTNMRTVNPAVLAVLFAAFFSILLSGCAFLTQPPQGNVTNDTHDYRIYGDPSVFFDSMSKSRDFSVVMDFTGSGSDEKNGTVIRCGVGIISSWTELGKNMSYLGIYALEDGDKCTKSLPGMNETYTMTIGECADSYTSMPYAYVSYGQPESYFSNSSWKMIVDENYMQSSECGFSQSQPIGR